MDSPPSLEALRVLAACVRHGSFSRAAVELCVTPSAVSARVRGLEDELGLTLFRRSGPKLVATSHAQRLAESVEGALESIRSAVDGCRPAQRALRVTCAPTLARWLVPRLASYHERADEPIELDATPAPLGPERFDVAIRFGRGGWPGVSAELLVTDRGAPMLSPKLVRSLGALSPSRLLECTLMRDPRWPRWFEAAGVAYNKPRFAKTSFATYELEAAAAVKGVGIALLSPLFYEDLLESRALVAPFEAEVVGPSAYWALWQKDSPCPHFVRWLQEALVQPPALEAADPVGHVR